MLNFWKYSTKFFGNCDQICEQLMVHGPSRATTILRSSQHLLRMNSNLVDVQSEQRERLEDECTALKREKKPFKIVTDQVLVIICQTW